jgi:hypothetical protein
MEDLEKTKSELIVKFQTIADKAKGDATTEANEKIEAKAKELLDKIEKSTTQEEFNTFKEQIAKQADALELKLKQQSEVKAAKSQTIRELLIKSIEEVMPSIKEIVKNGGKQTEPLIIKSPVNMGLNTTLETGSTVNTITSDTGIISTIRKRQEKYFGAVSVGAIDGKYALWIEETDEQGNPIFLAEAAGKPKASVKYVEKTEPVKKVAVYGKVTTEMMEDAGQFASYIENNLLKRAAIVTENSLFVGDGTSETLKGAKHFATAFTPGALINAVDDANEFDVLTAIALQVEVANGVPTAAFVHPSTAAKMKTIKATDGTPLWKQYTDFMGETIVAGMRLITTTAVPAGEFIAGDTSVLNVLFRTGLTLQVGLDGNDFTNNMKTILVEQRLVQFVSANDTPVLVKGTFTAAKALLDPAVADS